MANALFETAKTNFLGPWDWSVNKWKGILVDMDDAGPTVGAWKVSSVSNVVNPTITTPFAHGLLVGQTVAILGVQGATGANGVFTVASVPTGTTFTITLGVAPGAYVAGTGYIANLSLNFLSQFVPVAGRVATSTALASKTMDQPSAGVADAADIQWPGIAGDATEAVVLVRAAATDAAADDADSAQGLCAFYGSLSGLPLPLNPGTVTWTIDSGANRLFKV